MEHKHKAGIFALLGSISGLLGFFGTFLCCGYAMLVFFSIFGISFTTFIMTFGIEFLIVSAVSMTLGFFYYRKHKTCKLRKKQ